MVFKLQYSKLVVKVMEELLVQLSNTSACAMLNFELMQLLKFITLVLQKSTQPLFLA